MPSDLSNYIGSRGVGAMFPELAQLWRFRCQSHLGCAQTTISQIQSMEDTSNRSCRVDVSNSPVSKAVSSPHCADAIHRFMRKTYWCSGTSPITVFTPWSIVLIDGISRLGFVSPLFSQDMGFGRLIHRRHRYLKDFNL